MSAMVRDGRIASNGGHQLQSEHTGEGKEWTWFLHVLWLHMQKLPQQKYLTMSNNYSSGIAKVEQLMVFGDNNGNFISLYCPYTRVFPV